MNFQRGRYKEEPEINLVPLIDVMMVILIFLMITTTYSKFSGLEINAKYIVRPCVVFPASKSFTYGDESASWRKYAIDWSYVASL